VTGNKPWWTEPQVDYFCLDQEDHYVYRYRTHERAIQELKTRKIRMSPFAELNDPKESNNWRFDLASRDSRQRFDPNVEREIEESGTIFAKGHAKVLCVRLTTHRLWVWELRIFGDEVFRARGCGSNTVKTIAASA
jgi:hypothetical protein